MYENNLLASITKRYFRKLVEIILKGPYCVPITKFYFQKMLSVFEIFVNKVIRKLLHIR